MCFVFFLKKFCNIDNDKSVFRTVMVRLKITFHVLSYNKICLYLIYNIISRN